MTDWQHITPEQVHAEPYPSMIGEIVEHRSDNGRVSPDWHIVLRDLEDAVPNLDLGTDMNDPTVREIVQAAGHTRDFAMQADGKAPKRGDRFIHATFLADGARPPYDSDEKYAVHVVTATRRFGESVAVYHVRAEAYDAGNRRGRWYFDLDKINGSVRKWLP